MNYIDILRKTKGIGSARRAKAFGVDRNVRRMYPRERQGMKHVLVVEDSSMTRSMIRSVLEEIGDIETVEAASGFEALKILPTQDFQMVITDINMPDINGLELINFIRRNERFREIPLMIISTEKSEEDKRRGIALGANAYLTKPFTVEALTNAVKSLIA